MELHQVLGQLAQEEGSVADSVFFSKQTFLVLAVQALRPRGGTFLPKPESNKTASAAASVCLHHLFASHPDTPMPRDLQRARSAGVTRLRRSAPRRGLGIFGTWPCARVVGLLNVSGGKAPPRGTFAQRPWSWSGRGLKSPSHES